MISRKENFSGISHYPSLIIDNEPTKHTRLSWAYGDLCASLALVKGFKLLNVVRYRDEAMETLLLSAKRNLGNSLIHNEYSENLLNKGICQGTLGIVLLLSELNNYFSDQLVKESIGYWVNLTLSGNKNFNEGFLKTFTTREGELKWELSTGFLDGLSGIGLVLMSLSNPSLNKWKRLLLI